MTTLAEKMGVLPPERRMRIEGRASGLIRQEQRRMGMGDMRQWTVNQTKDYVEVLGPGGQIIRVDANGSILVNMGPEE